MRAILLGTISHISCVLSLNLLVLVHAFEVLQLATKRHIVALGHHRTVAKYVQAESDVLLPERELHKTPTQLGIVGRHIKTLHAVTHNTARCAETTHTITVVGCAHIGHIRQNVVGSRLAEGTLIVQTIGEGQTVIRHDGHIVAEGSRISVVGIGRTQPLGSQHHVCLSPYTARGRSLLIAGVEHKTKTQRAVQTAISLRVLNDTPLTILLKEGLLTVGEHLILVLILVDLSAIDSTLLEVAQVVTCLPRQRSIANLTHEVCLEQSRQAVQSILRGVEIHIVALLTCIDLLVIEIRLVTVETVEVHCLLVGHGQRGRETHARDPEAVVIRNHIQLRALGEERCLEIPLLAGIRIGRAVTKIVDIEQGTQLEALIGVECHSGQRSKVITRFDDLLLCGSCLSGLVNCLCHYVQRSQQSNNNSKDMFHRFKIFIEFA